LNTAIVKRLWDSPALTTGTSLATRFLNSAVVLWLALATFTLQEIVVWQLLLAIVAMQFLMDLGLTPTFVRLIAFAMGGAPLDKSGETQRHATRSGGPDWNAVAETWATVTWIYRRVTLAATLLLGGLGTLALIRPISLLPNPTHGWMAWIVVLIISPLVFAATPYSIYLQGLNQVASLRRWETLTGVGIIVSSLVILLAGGRVLALAVNSQAWALFGAWRNRRMALSAAGGKLASFPPPGKVQTVFDAAWPAAWRSGLGVIVAAGFVQSTGPIYAQIGEATAVAVYLVALRFASAVNQFSQAPFYSKLPLLAQLHAQGHKVELIKLARRGMRLSLWTYVGGVTVVAFCLKPALQLMRSSVSSPPADLWWLLAAAFFAERFGAMHLQLYSLTNHILTHIVNGISGTVSIVTVVTLYPYAGVYAFPLSLLAGYCGFYSWYCARMVYLTFQIPFFKFERTVGILAAFGLISGALLQFLMRWDS
jgi:hypothetical protein